MSKSLVIVESPAKAKTINKYLGENYIVEASVGHIKDLPKEGISIDIDAGFVPTYITIKGKEDVLKRLKNLAGRCERVFIATDPDREGEAIAHHIADEIRGQNGNIRRVLFNEITKSGITSAMKQPRDIDERMVQAQEARRVMDRLIGYKVSPFLWNSFRGGPRGLSAGRVQSVALRLVVEREKAINSFIPIEYWGLIGHFRTAKNEELTARLVRFDGISIRNPTGSATELKEKKESLPFISTKAQAEELRRRALAEAYHIDTIEKKEVKRNAPAPFTTSTIQQEASRRLKMATKRTMMLAQKLYEGVELGSKGPVGLITYMRTDSTRISDEAAQMAEEYIFDNYGKEYLPGRRPVAAQKKGANVQDAHEAIRPTDLKLTPKEARKHLDKELADLYELVWSRFVASQMSAAIFDQTTVEIVGGPFVFRASGRITRFRGWMQVYSDPAEEAREKKNQKGGKGQKGEDEESEEGSEGKEFESVLPEGIKKGDELKLEKLDARQSFTKPPMRYTESLLVKELEAKGIGRPSTYAAIISTIQDRGYVEQKERKLYATELGISVCDALVLSFPTLFDVKFTARMEGDLDTIAAGDATYLKVMERFYVPFQKALRTAQLPAGNGAPRLQQTRAVGSIDSPTRAPRKLKESGTKSDQICPKCGSPMELRKGQYGHYLACLGFPQCRNIISASEKGVPREREGTKQLPKGEPTGEICDKCGAPMIRRKAKGGSEFFGCSSYPECKNTRPIPLGITCPLCKEGQIVERSGGRYNAIFYGCGRYPECRFTSSTKPVNQPCKKCGNGWLTQAWSEERGEFLECPKCKAVG
jgi:DNA topoisomerase-1